MSELIDLDELRKLADAATPGPWAVTETNDSTTLRFARPYPQFPSSHGGVWYLNMGPENAAFIAAARIAVPELLDRLEAAEAKLANAQTGWESALRIVNSGNEIIRQVGAERDAALAKLAAVEALHRRSHAVFSWASGSVRYEDPCPECDGKAGVHPCGCWADMDIEYVCAACDRPGQSAPWPCPTVAALGLPVGGENDGE